MSAEVEGDYVVVWGEEGDLPVPVVRVGSPAVEEEDWGVRGGAGLGVEEGDVWLGGEVGHGLGLM